MISNDLDLMRTNFLMRLNGLSQEDQQKGIPSALIAEWLSRDIEVVNILMPFLGRKKLEVLGNIYWFEANAFRKLLNNIEGFLMRAD